MENVSFSYLGKFPALSGITMNIRQGEKVAVIGANGCGKSTLLHLLDALIFPDQGKISFLGKELKEDYFNNTVASRDFRKKVGLVFQNPEVQLFCPSVREDIIFGPLHLGFPKADIINRLDKVVSVLDIGGLLDRQPHQLSVGEKRKVALASVLIIEPEVLILDEPTAGLDPLTTRHIVDLLIQAGDEGRTVITSTHDLHIIEEIADTVYCFNAGKKIAASGQTSQILGNSQLLDQNNLAHIHSHRHKDKVHVHPHEHTQHHPDNLQ
ncbi:MAG: ABC transporter ATP-binding protein [Candidatus Omnitrophota bacterium]